MKIKVIDLLMEYLVCEGVEYIFGVTGAPIMPLFDSALKNKNIEMIITKHEEGAAFMADGYARVTGKLGVCCGTAGPGSTNMITGIATSYTDSIPLLVITAQVSTRVFGRGALQESTSEGRSVSTVELFKNFTKYSTLVFLPERFQQIIEKSLRLALCGRKGPVHINIPPDVMNSEIEITSRPDFNKYRSDSRAFDRYKVNYAVSKIIESKNPVFLIGTGVSLSDANSELLEFAEYLNIKVATSPKAKGGFPENHPLSLGVFGFAGNSKADDYILNQNHDLLIGVGISFDEWSTHCWDERIISNGLIQIDIDPEEIGKNYPVIAGIVGDAKVTLREMLFEIKRRCKRISKRNHDIRKNETDSIVEYKSRKNCINPKFVFKAINEIMPDDTIFFIDSGNHTAWSLHNLKIQCPKCFIMAIGFGAMGYATAAAIGGKLGARKKTVVTICGDGCFFMNGMEIATAVNYEIPAIWIVFNDSRLNMIYQGEKIQNKEFYKKYQFKDVDISKLAIGMGAISYKVFEETEFYDALEESLHQTKPVVIDVTIDRDVIAPLERRIAAVKRFMNRK